jgi:hypothetical protein
MEELRSNKRNIIALVLAGVVIFSLLLLAMPVSATPPSGLTGEPIAGGILPEVVRAKFKTGEGGFTAGTDVMDIRLVKFTLEPGGTFGWHQHSGPVWAIITSGTLSIYDGDDSTCTPHFYEAGSALLDIGSHTHLGINETNDPVEIYATFMLPEGGLPRLDAEDPGLCN